jgi:hypothetical protein
LYYVNTLKRDDFDDRLHLVLLLLFTLDMFGGTGVIYGLPLATCYRQSSANGDG